MNLTLNRTHYRPDGIFGMLTANKQVVCATLEHAYMNEDGSYVPKVPEGNYLCVRGSHRLLGMTEDFTTYEILNVPEHNNILFHSGNWNNDSEGCVLLGQSILDLQSPWRLVNSKIAFEKFMIIQNGTQIFSLQIFRVDLN